MIKALSVPVQEDITEFTQFLWQHEIPHRVVHQGAINELWVAPNVDPKQIVSLFEMWRRGVDLSQVQVQKSASKGGNTVKIARKAWLSMSCMLACLVVTLLIAFGDNFEYMRLFSFTELVLRGEDVYTASLLHNVETFQLWRFITPIFMHFSEIHLLFNCLWIWILGTRMELMQGRAALLALIILTGIASNFAQYYVSGPGFGGFSGVVYALLGYSWLWDKQNSHNQFGLPPAMMGFMIFWLALGYTGLLESIGLGAIANTAHLAGLIAGILFYPLGRFIAKR